MSVKISAFEIENIKRVKAVAYEPDESGLTVLGGKNGQGKTSVLDAIAWALGGNKFAPSAPYREGSTIPPHLKIRLSNGIVVERSGKNSSLKVIDTSGNKGGQALLDAFVSQFALNLPKFMNASGKDKADTLLQIIGVGDKVYELETQETQLYNERRAIGRIADQKEKFAAEMPEYEGVPLELVSASELIQKQQDILARNGENHRLRNEKDSLENQANALQEKINLKNDEIRTMNLELTKILAQLERSRKTVAELHDESTAELEQNIIEIEDTNRKVRANLDKAKAEDEAKEYYRKYVDMTTQLESIRQEKHDLLNNAELPLEGLSVENGELTYNGFKWDGMSSSEQLRVATAIVRKLNPECGFVLLDKLEQMDTETLKEFALWLESEGLQAIATRVSSGDECSIIIEDGYIKTEQTTESVVPSNKVTKTWTEGEF